eukprot:gene22666-26912_t
MTREEFLRLFEKQLQGSISPEEEARLAAWFEQQQAKGLSAWDPGQLGNQKELEEAIYEKIRQKDSKKGVLRLYRPWLSTAASILLLSMVLLLWQRIKQSTEQISATAKAIKYAEAKSGYGQVLKIVLADSSTVWLNSGSRLRYPEKFNGSSRELYLEGEAFFNVVHKKSQPFIVHSGALNTQVLGTSFNIKAYKNSAQLKVSVATGKVGIYADKVSTLLSQALEDISNKYGVHITASPNMSSCRIYGTFNHDNVETLLKMISYSVNGKVIRKTEGFYLSGKGWEKINEKRRHAPASKTLA